MSTHDKVAESEDNKKNAKRSDKEESMLSALKDKAVLRRFVIAFLICILIGCGITVQSRNAEPQRLYVSPKTISDYQALIDSEHSAIESLRAQIAEDEQRLIQYEEERESKQSGVVAMRLAEDLEKYLIMSGQTRVCGEGVCIIVDDATRELFDGENINDIIVHDADILMIINELKKCKAEAIAVNGHRITPRTSITCSGYTVRMDGQVYARPFEITAIGDSKRISNALLAKEGYGTQLRDWGVQFSLEVVEELQIEPAEKASQFWYSRPATAEEIEEQKL